MADGTDAALAAAEIADAVKASGVLIRIKPEEFTKILARTKDPLVVPKVASLPRTTNT